MTPNSIPGITPRCFGLHVFMPQFYNIKRARCPFWDFFNQTERGATSDNLWCVNLRDHFDLDCLGLVMISGDWKCLIPSGEKVISKAAQLIVQPRTNRITLRVRWQRLCFNFSQFLTQYLNYSTNWRAPTPDPKKKIYPTRFHFQCVAQGAGRANSEVKLNWTEHSW